MYLMSDGLMRSDIIPKASMSPERILSMSSFVSSGVGIIPPNLKHLVLLNYLLHRGLSEEGAMKLVQMRIHYMSNNPRWDGNDPRLEFARWLYLTGKISG
jgi:hypothetical protein